MREDGTVYCSAYHMTAGEYFLFERRMEETEDLNLLECLKSTLDVKKLDNETRNFLGIE